MAWLLPVLPALGLVPFFASGDAFGGETGLIETATWLVLLPAAILGGLAWRLRSAFPTNWLGWWIASLFEFGLGHRARTDLDLETRIAMLPAWLRQFPVDHPAYLILSRQIPWAGGHIATLIPGAMAVPIGRFIWCSAVAIVPAAVLWAAVGTGLVRLAS